MRNDVPRTAVPRLFALIVSAGLRVTRKVPYMIGARAEAVVTEIVRKCRRITRSGAPRNPAVITQGEGPLALPPGPGGTPAAA